MPAPEKGGEGLDLERSAQACSRVAKPAQDDAILQMIRRPHVYDGATWRKLAMFATSANVDASSDELLAMP